MSPAKWIAEADSPHRRPPPPPGFLRKRDAEAKLDEILVDARLRARRASIRDDAPQHPADVVAELLVNR
jgi:hypothetical protein